MKERVKLPVKGITRVSEGPVLSQSTLLHMLCICLENFLSLCIAYLLFYVFCKVILNMGLVPRKPDFIAKVLASLHIATV